jgi:mRNA interferase MazF
MLGPTVGVGQSGVRPALVVSNDWFNQLDNFLVWIVPVTGTDRKIRYQVKVKGREGGLGKASVIMCEQVRAVDRQRLLDRRGTVEQATLARTQAIVAMILEHVPEPAEGSTGE